MPDTKKTIYLAGGRTTGWREVAKLRFHDKAECIDPFKDLPQGAVHEFTHGDLEAVRMSDIVVGVNDYPRYTGMALEFGYAHALGKTIIYVPMLHRVDSMMAGVSTALFTNVNVALDFIEERYL